MSDLSRRVFLKRGSLAVAATGAVAAVPGLPMLLSATEGDAPAASNAAGSAAGETTGLTDTLVAHVKDLQTGEISLFLGEREVTYVDANLARFLHQAAR